MSEKEALLKYENILGREEDVVRKCFVQRRKNLCRYHAKYQATSFTR